MESETKEGRQGLREWKGRDGEGGKERKPAKERK